MAGFAVCLLTCVNMLSTALGAQIYSEIGVGEKV